ncbi:heparan-alpha-glucosaminide N-acetyltransferase [Methylocystis sp.]|uniref:heparan-alpha-glucosaminide N-acetyltransferase n=1 Tax=Methylocystis sp. TaxID=1911079 RepID=UPI003DA54D3F
MSQGRWWALDAARGLAVLAMVVFHVIWDLAHFGYAPANLPWSAPVKIFGHSIAFAFLFIAGVALVLANRDSMRWPAFWRRFALIGAAAALVTAGTYALFPTSYVFFGILHCIAVASLIAAPLLFAPWPVAFACAAFFLLAGEFFASSAFNADWLQWIGLSTSEPMTQDWRPLFPWAGALLLGVAMGKLAIPVYEERLGVSGEGANPLPTRAKGEWLPFLGRHSLFIYLAHQPALFALLMGLAYLIPPAVDATEFVASCEAHCMEEGGEGKTCHDACACTAREAISSKALTGVTDEAERGRRLNEIAQKCVTNGR